MISRPYVFIVILFGLMAGPAAAAVTPEIPVKRTTQVYSPFQFSFGDSGETIFENSGSVGLLGYTSIKRVYDYEPTATAHTGDLRSFMNFIQTPAGVLFLVSHGNVDNIMVEAYPPTPEGFAQATTTIQGYLDDNVVASEDIGWSQVSDGKQYYGISVTADFFIKYFAAHGIVYGGFCNSTGLSSAIMGSDSVRDYVGFDGEIYYNLHDGLKAAGAIFENMSGARTENGSYANHSIESVIPIAQNDINVWYRSFFITS